MKIYFVRHGQTDWNRDGKIQGQADIPLNVRGREEAAELAIRLKDIAFDKVYSSPLCRARETADIILQGRSCSVIYDDRLLEISYGTAEGALITEIKKSPDEELYYYFHAPEKFVPPKGGESLTELLSRCSEFLFMLRKEEQECRNVLVSCHGALIKGMIIIAKELGPERFWTGNEQKNCAVTILCVRNGKWILEKDGSLFL